MSVTPATLRSIFMSKPANPAEYAQSLTKSGCRILPLAFLLNLADTPQMLDKSIELRRQRPANDSKTSFWLACRWRDAETAKRRFAARQGRV
jgi:hypothetical protein